MRQSFIALLLCLSISAFGQKNFGIAIGLDNTKFIGEKPDGLTYKFKRGFSATAFVDFRISDQVQLSIRPTYGQGGANAVIDETINTTQPIALPVNTSYASIATLVKIFEREKIYAFVGPELSQLLTAEVVIDDKTTDVKKDLKSLGLLLDIGFGLNFDMLKHKWAVEWQFNQMLSTMSDVEDLEQGLSPRLRASRGRISLLYKFKRK